MKARVCLRLISHTLTLTQLKNFPQQTKVWWLWKKRQLRIIFSLKLGIQSNLTSIYRSWKFSDNWRKIFVAILSSALYAYTFHNVMISEIILHSIAKQQCHTIFFHTVHLQVCSTSTTTSPVQIDWDQLKSNMLLFQLK